MKDSIPRVKRGFEKGEAYMYRIHERERRARLNANMDEEENDF